MFEWLGGWILLIRCSITNFCSVRLTAQATIAELPDKRRETVGVHSIVRGPPAAVEGDFASYLRTAYELLSFDGWPARRSTAPKVGFDGKPERVATTLTPPASPSVTKLCQYDTSRSPRG
jgi:hypothetical protein